MARLTAALTCSSTAHSLSASWTGNTRNTLAIHAGRTFAPVLILRTRQAINALVPVCSSVRARRTLLTCRNRTRTGQSCDCSRFAVRAHGAPRQCPILASSAAVTTRASRRGRVLPRLARQAHARHRSTRRRTHLPRHASSAHPGTSQTLKIACQASRACPSGGPRVPCVAHARRG